MSSTLAEKLQILSQGLTPLERENLKILLSSSCESLVADAHGREPDVKYKTAMSTLSSIQPHSSRVNENGVQWKGRPEFMSANILGGLNAEGDFLRGSATRFDDHRVSRGGEVAFAFGNSPNFLELIEKYAGKVRFSGRSNYTYYDETHFGVDPHVDNVEFPLIAILMLQHKFSSDPTDEPSGTMIFRDGKEPVRHILQPGEIILIYSDSVMHSRVRMRKDEKVRIVVFGFQPI